MDYSRLFDLTSKVAVVIGGAGLLGQEFSRALAAYGAVVVVADPDVERCQQFVRAMKEENVGAAVAQEVDVRILESLQKLCAFVIDAWGKVDILVNSVAMESSTFPDPLEEFRKEQWEEVIAVNLNGVFFACQIFGREMIKARSGSIVNIASTSGVIGADKRVYILPENPASVGEKRPRSTPPVYTASKGGIIALTRQLAVHWAEYGVRVNAVSPAGVFTGQNKEFVANYSYRIPMGRMTQKHEISGAVVFLASDASSFITGHNLMVDGGMTAW